MRMIHSIVIREKPPSKIARKQSSLAATLEISLLCISISGVLLNNLCCGTGCGLHAVPSKK